MNQIRLILAVLVVANFFCAYDWTFHGFCMAEVYEQDDDWMLNAAGAEQRRVWLFVAYYLMAIAFVFVWALGGSRGGLLIALFVTGWLLFSYFFQPIPDAVIVRWIPAAFIELGIAGILTALIYRPKKKKAVPSAAASPPTELSEVAARESEETEKA